MKHSIAKFLTTVAASAVMASASAAASHPAFNVEVHGSGQPIILIPGLASPGAVWDDSVKHFCGQRQCHVLSLAGFAGVPAVPGPFIAGVEQQLSDYIAANKLDKPIVMGHSLGAFIGLKLAADHPDQVSRLVVVDTLPAIGARVQPDISTQQLKDMAEGMRQQMLKQSSDETAAHMKYTLSTMVNSPATAEQLLAWGTKSDRATVANAMYEMTADDLRNDVARIKAPTLVLGSWIAYKQYGPREMFEFTYRSQFAKLPNVTIALSDTAKHFIMYDDPSWMYANVDKFLK
jgi:pimeloyl-ACP methyl ester carboxylesterase